jgi:hypothetical protein
MANNAPRRNVVSDRRSDGRLKKPEAKKALLRMIAAGAGIAEAVEKLGFSYQTYENWRRDDPVWAREVSKSRRLEQIGTSGGQRKMKGQALPFSEFSEKYLNAKVFPHTQNVIDLIEKREPGWLHPAMTYVKGNPHLIIVNMPPEHASTIRTSWG